MGWAGTFCFKHGMGPITLALATLDHFDIEGAS